MLKLSRPYWLSSISSELRNINHSIDTKARRHHAWTKPICRRTICTAIPRSDLYSKSTRHRRVFLENEVNRSRQLQFIAWRRIRQPRLCNGDARWLRPKPGWIPKAVWKIREKTTCGSWRNRYNSCVMTVVQKKGVQYGGVSSLPLISFVDVSY